VRGPFGNYMSFDNAAAVMVVNYQLAREAIDKASTVLQGLMTDWYCNPYQTRKGLLPRLATSVDDDVNRWPHRAARHHKQALL
jgi:hypothetical protein